MNDQTPAEREAADAQWAAVAESLQESNTVRAFVQLHVETGADASATFRIPGDPRYLTIAFGTFDGDDEEDGE